MPKRNTVEQSIQSLTQADKDAAARKAAALATIPDPVFDGAIPFDRTYSDEDFNVRDAASYLYEDNKELFKSLKEKGLEKRGDLMAFHRMPDGRFKSLVGHLRRAMMILIRKEEIDRRETEGEPANPDTLPFNTVFGLVYQGLTAGQETALMADHIGRKDLNEFERCKEIGEMIERNGLTDKAASTHFGIDDNKIARYRMRWAMPTVMSEYRKEKSGDPNVPYVAVGQKALTALYSAYLKDRDAGCRHREEGANFRLAWETLKKEGNTPPAGPKAKSKDRDKVLEMVQTIPTYGAGPEMDATADILKWSAGEEGARLDVSLSAIHTLCEGYRETIASHEKAIGDMLNFIDKLQSENQTLREIAAERDSLANEVNTLRSENDTLRSENETLQEPKHAEPSKAKRNARSK